MVQLLEVLAKFEKDIHARGNYENCPVKETIGSRAGIDFRRITEDLTIGDINLETEVKKTILVEGTTEIGVRVEILVEAIEGRGDD
ncbi:hypothetical protein TNCV_4609321 [Trichonephila clavipes]|nr:hypothetical protein TNCV_4609321 [Trichonephila clavipes]